MSFLKSSAVVAFFTIISRFLGFIRDAIIARVFGASIYSDLFFTAFKIPNLLRSIFAEGAFTGAFVPTLADSYKAGETQFFRNIKDTLSGLIFVTIVASLLIVYFAPEVNAFIAPGFASQEMLTSLTRLMAPYIVFVSTVALFNAVLNCLRIFGAQGISQIVMNLVLILGALVALRAPPEIGIYYLAVAVLLGGLAQVVTLAIYLLRKRIPFVPSGRILSQTNGQVLKLAIPNILSSCAYQLNIIVASIFASLLPIGTVSWLFYADRLIQLPLGIVSISVSSVLLPFLANQESEDFEVMWLGLRLNAMVLLGGFGVFICSAPTFVSLLFERGSFGAQDVRNVTLVTYALIPAAIFSSSNIIISRLFLAKKMVSVPTYAGFLNLIFNFSFSYLLINPPQIEEFRSRYLNIPPIADLSFLGLSVASSVSSFVIFLFYLGVYWMLLGDKRAIVRYLVNFAIKSFIVVGVATGVLTLIHDVGILGLVLKSSLFLCFALGLIILFDQETKTMAGKMYTKSQRLYTNIMNKAKSR